MTHAARSTLPTIIDAVKALAHPGRLRILAMLRGGDLCVCQMTAVLELAASTVSSHLSDLRRAGLVTERKSGKWVHYHLVGSGPLADLVGQALRLVDSDDRLAHDARTVGAIRKIPIETFCATGAHRSADRAARVTPPTRRRLGSVRREKRR
jgi:DNA-binding transcriptional ArsR family regulator